MTKVEFKNGSYIQLGNCLEFLKLLAKNSINNWVFDPPYKYLKNQVLETDFDEDELVRQVYRASTKDASLVFFGRGSSYARLGYKESFQIS
jgi:hypothetical protein